LFSTRPTCWCERSPGRLHHGERAAEVGLGPPVVGGVDGHGGEVAERQAALGVVLAQQRLDQRQPLLADPRGLGQLALAPQPDRQVGEPAAQGPALDVLGGDEAHLAHAADLEDREDVRV
jgi:hypothetical protein